MTQRVARPMKFAAFISIILSVAVLFLACQGAVGPAGKDGKDGAQGPQGDSVVGPPGPAALYKMYDGDTLPVYINNGETEDSAGEAVAIDLSTLFAGGLGDITIGDVTTAVEAASQIFTSSEEDGVVTFAVRMSDADPPAPAVEPASAYVWNNYTVMIKDSAGPDLTLTLAVRRNRPPGDVTLTAFTLGTDSTKLETAATRGEASCESNQDCTLTIAETDTDIAVTSDKLSYEADFDSDAFEVVSIKGNQILFRGLETTDDGDAATTDDSVEVTITVTDLGGLENEITVDVSVDEAPNGSIPAQSIEYSTTAQTVITNLDSFFSDPDGDDTALTYTVKPGVVDGTVAAVTVTTDNPPALSILPAVASGGTTSVTIVATEASGGTSLAQTGEATFMLTVTP